jgi:hypothetical protein
MDDYARRNIQVANFPDHSDTIQFRHAQIEQRNIRPMGRPQIHRFSAIVGFRDHSHVVLSADGRRQALEDERVIIRDQKPNFGAGRSLAGCRTAGVGSFVAHNRRFRSLGFCLHTRPLQTLSMPLHNQNLRMFPGKTSLTKISARVPDRVVRFPSSTSGRPWQR